MSLLIIDLRHVHLRLAAIEEDYLYHYIHSLVGQDIALRHLQEKGPHQGSLEVAQPQKIAIQTLTGRAHSLVHVHGGRAHRILLDPDLDLPLVEAALMHVVTARRLRKEGGEEGVLATPAFQATAIEAAAGVKVDIDVGGVSVRA